jgi:hypothetical protein
MKERISAARRNADLAFWAEIVKAFPEATGGDFPPDAAFKQDLANAEAVLDWLGWNHPRGGSGMFNVRPSEVI